MAGVAVVGVFLPLTARLLAVATEEVKVEVEVAVHTNTTKSKYFL